MKHLRFYCAACILFAAVHAHAFGIGVKLTHNLGNIKFGYTGLIDAPTVKFSMPESGILHSVGIGAFFDTNVDGESWFGYRFCVEVLHAGSGDRASSSLIRVHFNNMPHFKLYQNDLIKLWIGPLISFGGVYGVRIRRSYILEFPAIIDFSYRYVEPFRIKIKNFYFNGGGAVGLNINLKNSNTLTVEIGARLGIGPALKTNISVGHIDANYTIFEGFISFGYLYRIIDSSAEQAGI
jgi:hypothetical protein